MPNVLIMLGLIAGVSAIASVASIGLYWFDKKLARNGGRRVPESRLLGVDAVGGWPGGAMARRWFRHKTHKPSFRAKWFGAVLTHLTISGVLLWQAMR